MLPQSPPLAPAPANPSPFCSCYSWATSSSFYLSSIGPSPPPNPYYTDLPSTPSPASPIPSSDGSSSKLPIAPHILSPREKNLNNNLTYTGHKVSLLMHIDNTKIVSTKPSNGPSSSIARRCYSPCNTSSSHRGSTSTWLLPLKNSSPVHQCYDRQHSFPLCWQN